MLSRGCPWDLLHGHWCSVTLRLLTLLVQSTQVPPASHTAFSALGAPASLCVCGQASRSIFHRDLLLLNDPYTQVRQLGEVYNSTRLAVKLLKVAGKVWVFLSAPPLPLKQVRNSLICIKWLEGDCVWEATLTRHRPCIFLIWSKFLWWNSATIHTKGGFRTEYDNIKELVS